jgi:tetratricopeptide (TPR) repeat protein
MKALTLTVCAIVTLLFSALEVHAQRQAAGTKKYEIIVYISDIEGNAIPGIVVSTKGKGSACAPSDGSGRTILVLQGDVAAGAELDLVLLVDVRENEAWEIIPNYRPQVPVLSNSPNAHSTLVLKPRKLINLPTQNDGLALIAKDQLQSELANVYANLGHSEFAQKNYADAFFAFKAALEKRPEHDDNLYYAALSLLQLKKYTEVLSYIEKCLQIRSHKPESMELALSHEIYASALNGLGRIKEAEEEAAVAKAIRLRLLAKQDTQR